jgi:hypothetical protein
LLSDWGKKTISRPGVTLKRQYYLGISNLQPTALNCRWLWSKAYGMSSRWMSSSCWVHLFWSSHVLSNLASWLFSRGRASGGHNGFNGGWCKTNAGDTNCWWLKFVGIV